MYLFILGLFLVSTSSSLCQQFGETDEDLNNPDDFNTLYNFMEKIYVTPKSRQELNVGEKLFLSPLIAAGDMEKARKAAYVTPDLLNYDIESYSGFLTVDEKYNSNIWFWYFPVQNRPVESTPWIIWLQGGPGASSLYGLFEEIGPFSVDENLELQKRKYSWGLNHSLLFIDNPVGTGFSFTEDDNGYATNQTQIAKQLYHSLQQFLTLFPELRKAPLFISGESYAGKHIPSLGYEIHEAKKTEDKPINLKGLMIGDGFIDPYTLQHYAGMMKDTGLIDEKHANSIRLIEAKIQENLDKGHTLKAFSNYNLLLNIFIKRSQMNSLYNYIDDVFSEGYFTELIQTPDMRNALHVGNTNYSSIGTVYKKLIPDFMNSAKTMLEALIPHYRVMSFCGQLDIIVAYDAIENTYANLLINGKKKYRGAARNIWLHDGKVAGYYKKIDNFTEVMIRKAGHMVPHDQPSRALGLISAFVRGIPLSEDTGIFAVVDDDEKKL